MKIPNVKGGQALSLLYIIAILTVMFVLYQVLGKIGLIKTGKRKKVEAEQSVAEKELRTAEYFNPMFLKGRTDEYKSMGSIAKNYAAQLYQAMHRLGTDEELIYSIFGKLYNKWNIGEISMYYRSAFNVDLITDLLNELTDKEQATLWNIINQLPNK
jgi:hypothetical protein